MSYCHVSVYAVRPSVLPQFIISYKVLSRLNLNHFTLSAISLKPFAGFNIHIPCSYGPSQCSVYSRWGQLSWPQDCHKDFYGKCLFSLSLEWISCKLVLNVLKVRMHIECASGGAMQMSFLSYLTACQSHIYIQGLPIVSFPSFTVTVNEN